MYVAWVEEISYDISNTEVFKEKMNKCLKLFINENYMDIWLYVGKDVVNKGTKFCICKNYKKGFEVLEFDSPNEKDIFNMCRKEVSKLLMDYFKKVHN